MMRLRRQKAALVTRFVTLAALLAAPLLLRPRAEAVTPPPPVDPTCSTAAVPASFTSSALDTITPERTGVTFEGGKNALTLQTSGGIFNTTSLGTTDLIVYTCAADFDGDGWTDFIGAGDASEFIRFYKNRTYENPEPDWADPLSLRTPKFVMTTEIQAPVARVASRGGMACADFNGDGFQDFVYHRIDAESGVPYRANMYRGNGDGTFKSPHQFVSDLNMLQRTTWPATNMTAYDYNGDGALDLIYGAGTVVATSMTSLGGDVLVLLNDGSSTTTRFTPTTPLLADAGFNYRGPVALGYYDFTGDGVRDLLASGPSTNKVALYPGLVGGGVSTTYQTIPFTKGGASVMLVADFSGDGLNDFMLGTDNFNYPKIDGFNTDTLTAHTGGNLYYFVNDGDSEPFSGGAIQQLTTHVTPDVSAHVTGTLFDYDTGFIFDYDHDPDNTLDVMIADGNNAATFYVFANRKLPQYVDCGEVASGVLDIGTLAATEMTVTEVRIDPGVTLNGGDVDWYASNNAGVTWVPANPCSDDPTELCVTFPTTVGNLIRWKAVMCSNPFNTTTPEIFSVAVEFTYVTATNHFRSGPIARDGMIYVGATRQPGEVGHYFGIADDTGATLWDSGPLLDAIPASSRNMYTVTSTGVRKDFSTSSATDADFRATINAATALDATLLVDWQQSARFGLAAPLHVLGGIENSTSALLTPPQAPYWYVYSATSAAERTLIDAYITANQTRPQLIFVGAKDGALHAFRTNPSNGGDLTNGTEAWAFIPYDVAQRLASDQLTGVPSAYPDGSPTLASAKVGGAWRTVLVMGEGNGGRSVFALDVTETVDPISGVVNGPTPLWRFTDTNMGKTYSKPTIIRTLVSGTEQWLAVFASGKDTGDLGDTVYALDLTTGSEVWRFEIDDTNCYVSSDITAVETDDEPGTLVDGFIDRLFFADSKGRVWKVDPGSGLALGSVSVGLASPAVFSTANSPGALGEERAISGTIAAAPDQSGRLALYFGTGGTEETPNDVQNMFFAVYGDTGQVRSTIVPAVGVKYYGGVALNDGQLIFSDGTDLSGLGLCAPSAGEVVAVDANTFVELFNIPVGSKIMAPIYLQNGEFYTINMQGQLVTSPYVPPVGGGGGGGGSEPVPPGGSGGDGSGKTEQPFVLLQWRHVY